MQEQFGEDRDLKGEGKPIIHLMTVSSRFIAANSASIWLIISRT